jgi:hypothetical protein
MNATFVKSIETLQTGGYIMNDIITLNDNTVICVTEDGIYYFKNIEEYNNNGNFEFIER